MYLVFTRMPGETYHGQLGSLLLYLCYIILSTNYLPCVLILLISAFANVTSKSASDSLINISISH